VTAARRALEAAEAARDEAAEECITRLGRQRASTAEGAEEAWQELAALALRTTAGGMWTADEGRERAGPTERNAHARGQEAGATGAKPGLTPDGTVSARGAASLEDQEAACLQFDCVVTLIRAQLASAAASQAHRDSLRDPPPEDPVAAAALTRRNRRL